MLPLYGHLATVLLNAQCKQMQNRHRWPAAASVTHWGLQTCTALHHHTSMLDHSMQLCCTCPVAWILRSRCRYTSRFLSTLETSSGFTTCSLGRSRAQGGMSGSGRGCAGAACSAGASVAGAPAVAGAASGSAAAAPLGPAGGSTAACCAGAGVTALAGVVSEAGGAAAAGDGCARTGTQISHKPRHPQHRLANQPLSRFTTRHGYLQTWQMAVRPAAAPPAAARPARAADSGDWTG